VSRRLPQEALPGEAEAPRSRRRVLGSLVRQRPSVLVGFVLLGSFVLVALLANHIQPYPPTKEVGAPFAPPSAHHPLGLDDGGIDMVSLLIQGSRISLEVGVAAALVATFIGGSIGMLAGYFGGATDIALMRITDYFIAIPDIALMIVVAAIWGPSLFHVIMVIGILAWTDTARIVRAQVKSVRERVYVKRARATGAGHTRLILRHVLPQISPLLVAYVVLTVAAGIFDETVLAFLGLSDPTHVSWGTIIEHAFLREAVSRGAWWTIVPAGICVGLAVIGCYQVGQAIEDALNPRLRVAHLSIKGFRFRAVAPRAAEAAGS
jgi:peptide/nickel transport system permease protein